MNKFSFSLVVLVFTLFSCNSDNSNEKIVDAIKRESPATSVNNLGIKVSKQENREYSFTDKISGYWYASTSTQVHSNMFDGWTVNRKHILHDYKLFTDGKELLRADATVFPNKIERTYGNVVETFAMFDNLEALLVSLKTGSDVNNISISLLGDDVEFVKTENNIVVFKPKNYKSKFMGVSTIKKETIAYDNSIISADSKSDGFFILLANSEEELITQSANLQENYKIYLSERESRMNNIVGNDIYLKTNNADFDKSFGWIALTMDELVTKQMGHGIYAGLPWFNDYWGRDMFISLPGSNLVTGQFNIAKQILLSFAKYQLTDKSSKYYGRIPNRARPDDVIYNTTDGTPRFVIQVYEYVKYTGDTDLIKQLYPVIKRSIDGSLDNWVDSKGYLTHENADTWMDAKRNGHPFSPRGNRANDIQALWLGQLQAGAYFADFMKNTEDADKWNAVAEKLESNFLKDFYNKNDEIIADRLLESGDADYSMRPNQLFAMDFINSDKDKMMITKNVWDKLVYPWGVASLSQEDDYFHPYHHWDEMYFFDEAYHNGTVWVWNNGIAIQRMIEAGQKDIAYRLMKNMQEQVMHTGAVGSISENFDAIPRDGKNFADKTGTFLQAWSNAEYLRVWYQSFIGIMPNSISKTITITPRIPSDFKNIEFSEKIMNGEILGKYSIDKNTSIVYDYKFNNIDSKIILDLEGYKNISIDVVSGDFLSVNINDNPMLEIVKANGEIRSIVLDKSSSKLELQKQSDELFKSFEFLKPKLNEDSFIYRRKKEGKLNINEDN